MIKIVLDYKSEKDEKGDSGHDHKKEPRLASILGKGRVVQFVGLLFRHAVVGDQVDERLSPRHCAHWVAGVQVAVWRCVSFWIRHGCNVMVEMIRRNMRVIVDATDSPPRRDRTAAVNWECLHSAGRL